MILPSLFRTRILYAVRPFATNNFLHYGNHQKKSSWTKVTTTCSNKTGSVTKDTKYKDVMTAEKWHGDVMAQRKAPGEVVTASTENKQMMAKTDEQSRIIVASEENSEIMKHAEEHKNIVISTTKQGDIVEAPKEHHTIMAPTEQQHSVVRHEGDSTEIMTPSKEHGNIMHAERKHADLVTSSKLHEDVMKTEPIQGDMIQSKKDQVDVMASSTEPHDVMVSSEKDGDIMVAGRNSTEHEESRPLHIPVMSTEVLELINPQDGQIIFDLTFGAGGHTKQILEQAPGCTVYALDRDPQAHELAKDLAQQYGEKRIIPLLGRFSELPALLGERGVGAGSTHAVLMDLGASSMQFDQPLRGFRVSADGPLDMRMDGDRSADQMTAADAVNTLDEVALARIISQYGEEKHARSIATAIVESRYAFGDITTTGQLIKVINSVFAEGYQRQDKLRRHSHVATKTFQALRIFVNNELNELSFALKLSHRLLASGGVCVAISFHSLEDRLVKRAFSSRQAEETETSRPKVDKNFDKRTMAQPRYKQAVTTEHLEGILQKKWIDHRYYEPSIQEVMSNPRARSAKLRVAKKP